MVVLNKKRYSLVHSKVSTMLLVYCSRISRRISFGIAVNVDLEIVHLLEFKQSVPLLFRS